MKGARRWAAYRALFFKSKHNGWLGRRAIVSDRPGYGSLDQFQPQRSGVGQTTVWYYSFPHPKTLLVKRKNFSRQSFCQKDLARLPSTGHLRGTASNCLGHSTFPYGHLVLLG